VLDECVNEVSELWKVKTLIAISVSFSNGLFNPVSIVLGDFMVHSLSNHLESSFEFSMWDSVISVSVEHSEDLFVWWSLVVRSWSFSFSISSHILVMESDSEFSELSEVKTIWVINISSSDGGFNPVFVFLGDFVIVFSGEILESWIEFILGDKTTLVDVNLTEGFSDLFSWASIWTTIWTVWRAFSSSGLGSDSNSWSSWDE
jgi:hypothetical protein